MFKSFREDAALAAASGLVHPSLSHTNFVHPKQKQQERRKQHELGECVQC